MHMWLHWSIIKRADLLIKITGQNVDIHAVSGCKISVHQLVPSEVLHSFSNLKAHVNQSFLCCTDLQVCMCNGILGKILVSAEKLCVRRYESWIVDLWKIPDQILHTFMLLGARIQAMSDSSLRAGCTTRWPAYEVNISTFRDQQLWPILLEVGVKAAIGHERHHNVWGLTSKADTKNSHHVGVIKLLHF